MGDNAIGRVETMRVGMLGGGKGERFPMSLFRPHEEQAERNHYQSLDTLERRGGLGWCEALAIIEDRDWSEDKDAEAKFRKLALDRLSPDLET